MNASDAATALPMFPEVSGAMNKLALNGLDPYAVLDKAIERHVRPEHQEITKEIASVVARFLMAELKKKLRKPATTFVGRLLRSIFG
jgi:hypothetical protein